MKRQYGDYLVMSYRINYYYIETKHYYIIDTRTCEIVSDILTKKQVKKKIQQLQINDMMNDMMNKGVVFSQEQINIF